VCCRSEGWVGVSVILASVPFQENLVDCCHFGLEDLAHLHSQIWLLSFLPEQCGQCLSSLDNCCLVSHTLAVFRWGWFHLI